MKPLLSEERDPAILQNLGRASLQIVHDIKNQLNGLKLYATYLRKRMEKIDEAAELQETLGKLIGGLDRAATDLNVLVQYGRPISLTKNKGVDLQKLMRGVSANCVETGPADSTCEIVTESEAAPLVGDFDQIALGEAFKAISVGAMKSCSRDGSVKVSLKRKEGEPSASAIIEWQPVNFPNEDPFSSFSGGEAIRMSLAAKIVEAHGGSAEHSDQSLRVSLPLNS
jgi:light-regulated signal transduction histidine kinase (bacteriophytochrome)